MLTENTMARVTGSGSGGVVVSSMDPADRLFRSDFFEKWEKTGSIFPGKEV